MNEEQGSPVLRFLGIVAIAVVVLLVFMGLICWVVGWTPAYQYGTALIVGGW